MKTLAPANIPATPTMASLRPSPHATTPVPGQYPNIAIPIPKRIPPMRTPPNNTGLICRLAISNATRPYTPIAKIFKIIHSLDGSLHSAETMARDIPSIFQQSFFAFTPSKGCEVPLNLCAMALTPHCGLAFEISVVRSSFFCSTEMSMGS